MMKNKTIQVIPIQDVTAATAYVESNLRPADKVDEIKTLFSNEINKVWWDKECSGLGRTKIAHYNSEKQLLYVY